VKDTFIIGSVIAVIAAAWGYIRQAISYVRSLVIVNVYLEAWTSASVMSYLWHKCRRVKIIGDRKYISRFVPRCFPPPIAFLPPVRPAV